MATKASTITLKIKKEKERGEHNNTLRHVVDPFVATAFIEEQSHERENRKMKNDR